MPTPQAAAVACHPLTSRRVQQVFDNRPRFYGNRPNRRASHVMLGPTFEGSVLVVPLEPYGDALWRPVTAFYPSPAQEQVYRSRR